MPHLFPKTHFDFVGWRWKCIIGSCVIIIAGLITMGVRGVNWSIDFRGGLDMQVRFDQPVSVHDVRGALTGMDVGEVKTITALGQREEILVRIKAADNPSQQQAEVAQRLASKFPGNNAEIRHVDVVGPKVGRELRNQAIISALVAFALLLVYISWRFELSFAVGGIVALVHDTLVTLAFLAFFNYEFSLSVLAAILTLIGFSLNDTVVVYDRIRENLKKLRNMKLAEIMNLSINETLSRTVITSLTVFLTVLVVYIFGGPVLKGFSFAMLVGVVTGTYSSIYIAAPVVLEWAERRALTGKKR
jgi:preprotein translocase subunit SecF